MSRPPGPIGQLAAKYNISYRQAWNTFHKRDIGAMSDMAIKTLIGNAAYRPGRKPKTLYTANWSLDSIPDNILFAHAARRMAARRTAPREKLSACPHCGEAYGVAAMRKHRPVCRRQYEANLL